MGLLPQEQMSVLVIPPGKPPTLTEVYPMVREM